MRRLIFAPVLLSLLLAFATSTARAEDGYDLWLRYAPGI